MNIFKGLGKNKGSDLNMTYGENEIAPPKKTRDFKLLFGRLFVFVLPLLVIISAFIAFGIMGAMKPEPEKKEEVLKAVPVLTASARTENVRLSAFSQGEVQPRVEVDLVPQISGKISYMSPSFIEGGRFKQGDILVRIDPEEYKLRVVQAQARVAQAETALAREKSEAVIAAQDWQDIGSGTASALTLREPQMAEAEASLAAAKAALDEAELLLSRTKLSAPFTGRVSAREVNLGEFVSGGVSLGSIYGTDVMDVRLPLTNQNLAQTGLGLGFEASKTTPARPVFLTANVAGSLRKWEGQLVRTDSRYDPTTRVLYAYVEVKDPFGAGSDEGVPLAPGLFVNAEVMGEAALDAIIVPRAALRGDNQIYIANSDDTLSIRTVTVKSSDRDRVIISDGLSQGDRVITSPVRGVATGMKIARVEKIPSPETGETP